MKHALLAVLTCSLAVTLACSGLQPAPTATQFPTTIPTNTPAPETGGVVTLPRDEGVHLTPVEWWYFNGHLEDSDGREYSFHFVTFLTVTPDGQVPQLLQLGWADHERDVYLDSEKAALVNRQERTRNNFRFQAEGWGMAGDGTDYVLDFNIGGYGLELEATSLKPAALHQDTGLVDLGAAGMTYYYSRSRLSINGLMDQDDAVKPVSGWAWMDHQWGDFSVAPVGWDWASIQLDDGSELMISVVWDISDRTLINAYGTYVPASAPEMAPNDEPAVALHLRQDQIQWSSTGVWTSPETGAEYPQGWKVTVDSLNLSLQLTPRSSNAEFAVTDYVPVTYWEGAVAVTGSADGTKITGKGFVELVGYDERTPEGSSRGP